MVLSEGIEQRSVAAAVVVERERLDRARQQLEQQLEPDPLRALVVPVDAPRRRPVLAQLRGVVAPGLRCERVAHATFTGRTSSTAASPVQRSVSRMLTRGSNGGWTCSYSGYGPYSNHSTSIPASANAPSSR